jgi:hypothetical protein
VSKWISALLFYAVWAGGWLGQRLDKSLCFYAARADLAKQRQQLTEMLQWQLRDIGTDPIAAKAEAEKSSWGAEPPWQKPQWAKPQWKKLQWKKRQGQKPKRDRLVRRSFARR